MIRPAATLCALRQIGAGLQVLMVRRAPQAAFLGGWYVFPGGAVDDSDRSPVAFEVVDGVASAEMLPWVAAALREAFEETGLLVTREGDVASDEFRRHRGLDLYEALAAAKIRLDGGRLAYLSNWVAPKVAPRRFDTRFFVAEVSASGLTPDGAEVTETLWVSPSDALSKAEDGEWPMLLPTRNHLELLAGFEQPSDVVSHARAQVVIPIEPMVEHPNGVFRHLLPGDQGFKEAE